MMKKKESFGFFKDNVKNINKKLGYIKHQINELKEEETSIELVDYCTEYVFDFDQDNLRFNERFNEIPFMLEVDYTPILIHNIENVILLKANAIFFFYGPRDMGKSRSAQNLGFIIRDKELELLGRHNIVRSLTDDGKLRSMFREMDFGDITIRDESPKSGGEGKVTAKDCLDNVCQITRGGQYFFLFCNPTLIVMKDVDFYIEMGGKKIVHECPECEEKFLNAQINRITNCHVCGHVLDYDNDLCVKDCKIRAICYDRDREILGILFFDLHEEDEFTEQYLEQKMENIEGLMEHGGFVGVGPDGNFLEEQAIRLAQFCLKELAIKSKIYKSDLKDQIPFFNAKYPKKTIIGSGNEFKSIVAKAHLLLLEHRKKGKKIGGPQVELEQVKFEQDPLQMDFTGFRNDNRTIFKRIRKEKSIGKEKGKGIKGKWHNTEQELENYNLVKSGYDKKELAKSRGFKVETLDYNVKKVEGAISFYKGKIFEEFVAKKLRESKLFERVLLDGEKGAPDVLGYTSDKKLYVYSCKNLQLDPNKKWLPKSELNPEIEFASDSKDDYDTHMIVIIYDNKTEQICYLREYDYNNPVDITDF